MVEGFLRKMADAMLNGDDQQQYQDRNDSDREVRRSSEDPYGDPANYNDYGNVTPASQDPYGDPADTGMFGNIRPASEDPYGDPADEEERRW